MNRALAIVGFVLAISDATAAALFLGGIVMIVLDYTQLAGTLASLLTVAVAVSVLSRLVAGIRLFSDSTVSDEDRTAMLLRFLFIRGWNWDASRYLRGHGRHAVGRSRAAPKSTLQVAACFVIGAGLSACQQQTSRFALCASLQVQGGATLDATCWLRGPLVPVELLRPGMAFDNSGRDLSEVLKKASGELGNKPLNGARFKNSVSSFSIECADSQGPGSCVWQLRSEPNKALAEVLGTPLLEVAEYVSQRAADSGVSKLMLIEASNDSRSLSVEIVKGHVISLEWKDAAAVVR